MIPSWLCCPAESRCAGMVLPIILTRAHGPTVWKGRMGSIQEFRCEVCGIVTSNPIHWFIIRCGESELTVHRWNTETANAAGARHYCGEAHAQVYISRWFESVCSPPKPTFR
jgi:hypothetical protein